MPRGWVGFWCAEVVQVEEVGQGILGGERQVRKKTMVCWVNHDRVSMAGKACLSLEGHKWL